MPRLWCFRVFFKDGLPALGSNRAIKSELARARPVRRLAVPDDGAPPQRCPCCPCRGAEKAWLGAIRPTDSIARPRDRRSAVGVGLKGCLADRGHELPRRHRRLGGRSWAARRAVFGRFLAAALPTLGFLSRSKVRPPTSTQVLPVERCCSRRIVGGWVRRSSSSSRCSTSTRWTSSCSCSTSFRRSADPIRPSDG